jgi:hypothetical protein
VVFACLLLSAPVPAPADPKPVDIKNLSRETFLAEPDDVRPMLVAWVHGYTHAGGANWVVDAATARAFWPRWRTSARPPKASFRYQVLETAASGRPRSERHQEVSRTALR